MASSSSSVLLLLVALLLAVLGSSVWALHPACHHLQPDDPARQLKVAYLLTAPDGFLPANSAIKVEETSDEGLPTVLSMTGNDGQAVPIRADLVFGCAAAVAASSSSSSSSNHRKALVHHLPVAAVTTTTTTPATTIRRRTTVVEEEEIPQPCEPALPPTVLPASADCQPGTTYGGYAAAGACFVLAILVGWVAHRRGARAARPQLQALESKLLATTVALLRLRGGSDDLPSPVQAGPPNAATFDGHGVTFNPTHNSTGVASVLPDLTLPGEATTDLLQQQLRELVESLGGH
jgi:hypothetical protein